MDSNNVMRNTTFIVRLATTNQLTISQITYPDTDTFYLHFVYVSSGGILLIDGIQVQLNDLVLVKDQIDKDATITILTTGSGLKDIATALKGVKAPTKAIKSIDELL